MPEHKDKLNTAADVIIRLEGGIVTGVFGRDPLLTYVVVDHDDLYYDPLRTFDVECVDPMDALDTTTEWALDENTAKSISNRFSYRRYTDETVDDDLPFVPDKDKEEEEDKEVAQPAPQRGRVYPDH